LRHWCAEHGHDYDTIDARAAEVYEEEVLFAKEEAEEEKARVARPRRKRRKKRRPASPVRERAVGRVRERPRLA
jgi:sRNA-binding protein